MNPWIKAVARATGLSRLNAWRKRELKRRAVEKAKAHPFRKDDLLGQLRALGVEPGECVMVHSSLSQMGYVEGGAETLLATLLEMVGPEGTLLLPTYPVADFSLENLRSLPVLRPDSRSYMGKVTNLLLEHPDVVRSLHPTHAWAGVGPRAQELLGEHHTSVTPCGPGSPFEGMLEANGWVLTLGSDWGKCTYWHITEDRVEYPLPLYVDEEFAGPVEFPDGEVRQVPFRVHLPENTARRIDSRKGLELRFLERFRAWGYAREGTIGSGVAVAVRCQDFYAGIDRAMGEGLLIYEG